MRRGGWLCLMVLALTLTGGCTDRHGSIYANFRPVESLLPVQTLGWDAEGKTQTLTASASTGGVGAQARLISRQGLTLPAAMDRLQDFAAQENLFYAHTAYALVGQEAAEGGLFPLLDFILRGTRLRSDVELLLVRDGTARELIFQSGTAEYEISRVLSALSWDVELYGTDHVTSCAELAADLTDSGAALLCAVRAQPLEDAVAAPEDGRVTVLADGYGVIRGDRLVGWLEGDAALGANLLSDRAGIGFARLPDGQGGWVTVEFDSGSAAFSPVWDGDRLAGLHFRLRVRAGVVAMEHPLALDDPAVRARLGQALAQVLRTRAQAALTRSVSLEADFLGLGRALRAAAPERFAALDWPRAMADAQVTLDIRAEVERSYDLERPVVPAGEEDSHE